MVADIEMARRDARYVICLLSGLACGVLAVDTSYDQSLVI